MQVAFASSVVLTANSTRRIVCGDVRDGRIIQRTPVGSFIASLTLNKRPRVTLARITPRCSGLREWAESAGAKVDERLEVGDGLKVNADVLKGTVLVELPAGAALTSDSLTDLAVPESQARTLGEDTALGAVLMRAGSMKWLRELPASDAPYLWSEDQLKMLVGSPIAERAADIADELKSEHKEHADVLGTDSQAFLEAVACARAYGVRVKGKSVVAPFVASAGTVCDGDENAGLENRGGGLFSKPKWALVTRTDMKAGDEVVIDRVEAGTDIGTALLEVGSAVGGAACSFPVEVSKLDKFAEDKLEVLQRQNLAGSEDFILREHTGIGSWTPPEELLAYLRLVCLSGPDAFLLEPVFSNQIWYFMTLPVSQENESAVCEFVVGACEDALDRYAELAEPTTRRAELAKKVVDGEKKVLEQCKTWFERRKNSLQELQYYQERRLDELDLLRPLDESEIIDSGSGVRVGRAFDQNM